MKDRLDPKVDVFEAASSFRQLTWPVNEPVYDFLARYLELGIKGGLSVNEPIIGKNPSQSTRGIECFNCHKAIYQETAQIEMEHAESVGGEITKPGRVFQKQPSTRVQ